MHTSCAACKDLQQELGGCPSWLRDSTAVFNGFAVRTMHMNIKLSNQPQLLPVTDLHKNKQIRSKSFTSWTYLEQPCAEGEYIIGAGLLLWQLGGQSHWGGSCSGLAWGNSIGWVRHAKSSGIKRHRCTINSKHMSTYAMISPWARQCCELMRWELVQGQPAFKPHCATSSSDLRSSCHSCTAVQ